MGDESEDRTTRPMPERLLEMIQATNDRLGSVELSIREEIQNLGKDIKAGIQQLAVELNARFTKSDMEIKNAISVLGHKIDALNRRELQTEPTIRTSLSALPS